MFSSYLQSWIIRAEDVKAMILDASSDKTMKGFGFEDSFTKKRYLSFVLDDCLTAGNMQLFEALKDSVLKMPGDLLDEYYVNSVFVDYYHSKQDLDKAVEICIATLNNIDQYLPELIKENNKLHSALNTGTKSIDAIPSYIFCREKLSFLLVEQRKFDEAEKYEAIFHEKNLLPENNKANFLKMNRLVSNINYLISLNEISSAIDKCDLLINIDIKYASYGYKAIGNYFLKHNDCLKAYLYLSKAFELHPRIEGIDKKLKRLAEKLDIYSIDLNARIIQDLIIAEKSTNNWFEIRAIAIRYLSIEEFKESIRIFENLINDFGPDDTFFYGLSKAYQAMAYKQLIERDYSVALANYKIAFETIMKTKYPTKKFEKQRVRLKAAIDKFIS